MQVNIPVSWIRHGFWCNVFFSSPTWISIHDPDEKVSGVMRTHGEVWEERYTPAIKEVTLPKFNIAPEKIPSQ